MELTLIPFTLTPGIFAVCINSLKNDFIIKLFLWQFLRIGHKYEKKSARV